MASTGYRAVLVPAADQSRAGIPRRKKPAPARRAGFSGRAPKGEVQPNLAPRLGGTQGKESPADVSESESEGAASAQANRTTHR